MAWVVNLMPFFVIHRYISNHSLISKHKVYDYLCREQPVAKHAALFY